jgi:hypothetical protein
MNPDHDQQNIKDNVLKKIQEGHVAMRSRASFILPTIALVAVMIAVLVVSIFLFSYILFSVRVSGYGALVGFGSHGLLRFLLFFPWFLLALDLFLIGLLGWIVRQFKFGYHRPLLYMFLGLLVLTILLSIAVDRGTRVHDDLLRRADRHELPGPFGEIYEGARQFPHPEHGTCLCAITAVQGNTLYAQDVNSTSTVMITVPPGYPAEALHVGDVIFVAGGEESSSTIRAFGIHRVRSATPMP